MKRLLASFGMTMLASGSYCITPCNADSLAKSPISITADMMSSYVWRGVKATSSPSIQPNLSFKKGSFELGAWGSSDFTGSYKEVDFYTSYSYGNFKLGLTDYNWLFSKRYFNYRKGSTDHILEGNFSYQGNSAFPLSIDLNTMFYGSDKKATNPSKNAYSTYVEVRYPVGADLNIFAGMTPADGYYGDGYGKLGGFAVVNVGVAATRKLKMTESFSLPLKVTLGVNPQQEDVYLVFGITF